ncbi:MAG: hypothetical protein CMQ17_08140 [Gammaproteobacteria bacterium]|jgi:hypothetical protein|nr:hypothetical protein [Gammaproteobacteria bacterium]HJO10705.1 DUF6455 family protein [Gammaproteobacteria bacterium]
MDSILFEAYLPILAILAGIVIAVALFSHMRSASAGRMTRMMERVGLDSKIATRTYPQTLAHPQTEAIMKQVRRRCRGCQSEGLCERWLAGAVKGDNSFCPNAETFRGLASG